MVLGPWTLYHSLYDWYGLNSPQPWISPKVRDPWNLDGGALLYVLVAMEMGGMGGNIRTCQVCDGVPLYKCFIQAGGVSGSSCSGVVACHDEVSFWLSFFFSTKVLWNLERKSPVQWKLIYMLDEHEHSCRKGSFSGTMEAAVCWDCEWTSPMMGRRWFLGQTNGHTALGGKFFLGWV